MIFLDETSRHQGIVFKVARIYCKNEEDRTDLIQEIWLQLWKAYPGFKRQCSVSTWMYRVALNTALTFKKKKSREVVKPAGDVLDYGQKAQCGDNDSHDLEILLREAISTLNRQDKALILLYIEGLSYQQIREITGLTESNVGVRLSRIKEKLKTTISSWEK